jgi:hypothetical protein
LKVDNANGKGLSKANAEIGFGGTIILESIRNLKFSSRLKDIAPELLRRVGSTAITTEKEV